MGKYYVTCGKIRKVILGQNPLHAACKVFIKTYSADDLFTESIGRIFKVSEIGFSDHPQDLTFDTSFIIQLVIKSNEYRRKNEND